MGKLVEKLPDIKEHSGLGLGRGMDIGDRMEPATGAALRALSILLEQQDPQRAWGGLKKILTPEGPYYWLCEHHVKDYA
jgi:internalin A